MMSFPQVRKDLTGMLTITIDPFDARDFDDAISLQREDGRWRLWVHIADVSQFVPLGSKLDEEAQEASHQRLSARSSDSDDSRDHQQSLGQSAARSNTRLVKTCEIEMLDDLTVTHTEVHNAAIHSDMRLNYRQVDQFLADPDSLRRRMG